MKGNTTNVTGRRKQVPHSKLYQSSRPSELTKVSLGKLYYSQSRVGIARCFSWCPSATLWDTQDGPSAHTEHLLAEWIIHSGRKWSWPCVSPPTQDEIRSSLPASSHIHQGCKVCYKHNVSASEHIQQKKAHGRHKKGLWIRVEVEDESRLEWRRQNPLQARRSSLFCSAETYSYGLVFFFKSSSVTMKALFVSERAQS